MQIVSAAEENVSPIESYRMTMARSVGLGFLGPLSM